MVDAIDNRHKETLRRMRAGFDPEPIHTGLYKNFDGGLPEIIYLSHDSRDRV